MGVSTGKIPTRIRIYSRDKDGFATDHENTKTQATAASWSNSKGFFEIPNDPFTGLKLLDVVHRGNGGRAWKVQGKFGEKELTFDLREDVLLETMREDGIDRGPVLKGQYIFAMVNSEMKIIRSESKTAKDLLKYMEDGAKKAITSGYEIGRIYETKTGKQSVYLGKFWTRKHTAEFVGDGCRYHRPQDADTSHWRVRMEVAAPKFADVFVDVWSWRDSLDSLFEEKNAYLMGTLCTGPKSALIKKGKLLTIPDNFFELYWKTAYRVYKGYTSGTIYSNGYGTDPSVFKAIMNSAGTLQFVHLSKDFVHPFIEFARTCNQITFAEAK